MPGQQSAVEGGHGFRTEGFFALELEAGRYD